MRSSRAKTARRLNWQSGKVVITVSAPEDWRQLQVEVGRVLSECGFDVEIEKVLAGGRGNTEVDVYAEEEVDGRRYRVLCECKHWQARVPQGVIQQVRTVVAETGVNIGYIVSSAGFQSGAFTAAQLTNLKLVTWEEFQDEFEKTWLKRHLIPLVTNRCDPLLTHCEPLLPRAYSELNEEGQAVYIGLKEEHDAFGWLMMMFTTYHRTLRNEPVHSLPLRDHISQQEILDAVPAEILDATGYREFLEAALTHSDIVVAAFRAVLGRNGP